MRPSKEIIKLVQAKHQWETMLDALPQLIFLVDRKGHIIRSNRTLEKWGLGKVKDIKGKLIHEVVHPGCEDRNCKIKQQFSRLYEIDLEQLPLEWDEMDPIINKELSFCIGVSNESMYDDDFDKGGIFLVISDISSQAKAKRILSDYNLELKLELIQLTSELRNTNIELKCEVAEHKKNLQILRESEKKYNSLVESSLTGLYIIKNEKITFCNYRFAEIFGYTRDEIYQLKLTDLFFNEVVIPDESSDKKRLTGDDSRVLTVAGKTKEGFIIWLERYLANVELSNESMTMGNLIDITRQKTTEDALRLSQHELQLLSEKLLKSEEEQRKHIALELHDSIGQTIFAIKLGLENTLQEYYESINNPLKAKLKNEIQKLQGAAEEIRHISMNLRPSMLDDLGLLATIKWFIRESQLLFPDVNFELRLDVKESQIPVQLKIVLFRIVQEALNNTAKHALASSIKIEISIYKNSLNLLIKDDGQGFINDNSYIGKGYGLSSMKERVKLTKGNFSIESIPEMGTTIFANWDISKK